MENVIVVFVLAAIAAGILWYLIREKRRGAACVGCPHAQQCSKPRCSSCSGKSETKDFCS